MMHFDTLRPPEHGSTLLCVIKRFDSDLLEARDKTFVIAILCANVWGSVDRFADQKHTRTQG